MKLRNIVYTYLLISVPKRKRNEFNFIRKYTKTKIVRIRFASSPFLQGILLLA